MSGALKWSRLYFWGDSWWLSPKLNAKMQQRLRKPPLVKTRNVFILFKKFHIFSCKLLYSCVPNFHSEWFEVTCNQFVFGNKMTLPQKQLRLLCSVNVNLLNFQKKKSLFSPGTRPYLVLLNSVVLFHRTLIQLSNVRGTSCILTDCNPRNIKS